MPLFFSVKENDTTMFQSTYMYLLWLFIANIIYSSSTFPQVQHMNIILNYCLFSYTCPPQVLLDLWKQCYYVIQVSQWSSLQTLDFICLAHDVVVKCFLNGVLRGGFINGVSVNKGNIMYHIHIIQYISFST